VSEASKFFGWCRRKQKERRVPSAGITPEAVPRKGGKKKRNRINSNADGFVARKKGLKNEWDQ
jgi:hypothetical protein